MSQSALVHLLAKQIVLQNNCIDTMVSSRVTLGTYMNILIYYNGICQDGASVKYTVASNDAL